MKIQKKHLRIVLIALAAAILYNVYRYLATPSGASAAARPLLTNATARGPEAPAMPSLDPSSIPEPPRVDLALDPRWDRDAFLFGNETREVRVVRTAPPPAGPDPVVKSILFSTGRRLAVVDGRIVKVGDRVGQNEVVEIERAAVVFRTPSGTQRRVDLYQGGVQGITR